MKTLPWKQRGQGMAEFALTAPLILLVSLFIIDFGRALFTYAQITSLQRETLRRGGLTSDSSGTPSYFDCAALADRTKEVYFADSLDVKVQFIRYDDPDINNPTPVLCYDDTASPVVPASWDGTAQTSIEQGDIIQIVSDVEIQLLSPFLPETLSFQIVGNRTVITSLALGQVAGDDDFDGLDDLLFECTYFLTTAYPAVNPADVATICADSDLFYDDYDDTLDEYNATDDPDGDGCSNGCEENHDSHPLNPDTDGDTLRDGAEVNTHNTSPIKADSDGDGDGTGGALTTDYSGELEYTASPPCRGWDNEEVAAGSNARLLPDTDGDGVDDWLEICRYHTDPTTAPTIAANTLSHWVGGSSCDGFLADNYIGLEWPTLPDTQGFYVFANGTKVAELEGATQCGGSVSDPDTGCYEFDATPWNASADIQYSVQGYFGNVTGTMSPTITLQCSPLSAPGDPAQDGAQSSCPNTYIGLTWTPSVGATSYRIYAAEASQPLVLVGETPNSVPSCGGSVNGTNGCFNIDDSVWIANNGASPLNYAIQAVRDDFLGEISGTASINCSGGAP